MLKFIPKAYNTIKTKGENGASFTPRSLLVALCRAPHGSFRPDNKRSSIFPRIHGPRAACERNVASGVNHYRFH